MAKAWMEFKNSFAWLTGIKKQFFYHIDFSDSGHFLVTFLRFHGSKNSRSKKIYLNKKSVLSCPSTTRRNFWNPCTLVLYFYNFWPELQMAASNPGDKIFDGKLVGIVFTTCRIGISELILNLRAMGLT